MSKTNAAMSPISWGRALEMVLSTTPVPESIELPLLKALGHYCSADIHSRCAVPPFDNSSMDGYAVRAADVESAGPDTPVTLHIVGEVAAGRSVDVTIGAGQAAAIMTGAPVPAGADAVVKVESTRQGGNGTVEIWEAVRAGACIRNKGADTSPGDLVATQGTLVGPGLIGLIASVGLDRVPVYAKPRIALCTSGDEVVSPGAGQVLHPGQIYDSNSTMLEALLVSWGYAVDFLGRMPDSEDTILATLRKGFDYDYLVTVGGVSMGRHDYLRPCLEALGATEIFWKVNQQPGGPLLYARAGETRILGLPGNPVSCFVCADIYLRVALCAASGGGDKLSDFVSAELTEPLSKPHAKVAFIRAHLTRDQNCLLARSTGPQDSNRIRSIANHDGYIIFPEDKRQLEAGDTVEVLVLE